MTTPASGQIGLSDIRTEANGSGQFSLADFRVRALAGSSFVGSSTSQIGLANLYSKTRKNGGSITAGVSGSTVGYNAVIGSISQSGSVTVIGLVKNSVGGLAVSFSGLFASNAWTYIGFDLGTPGTQIWATAGATWSQASGNTSWVWTAAPSFANGGTYQYTIV